jgi:hypothetical protein
MLQEDDRPIVAGAAVLDRGDDAGQGRVNRLSRLGVEIET